ncbi:alpha carbonic anhydrase 7-like [Magnolia sinica]|uniref:alpha carbonic anhydrase 7-like n=1 Tax=Magnolia sinica TaxID=86752 RepID=UPI00265A7C21|nr:alpha carbonic anhydrase 7-like [Magnolia sinica]
MWGVKTNLLLISSLLLLPFNCTPSSEVEDEHAFDYLNGTGKGPERWGEINPEWRICDNGNMQSPIDLLNHRVEIMPHLGRLHRKYKPDHAFVMNRGHDIMLKWKRGAGSIIINGIHYTLKQCHWHSPSEHTFNGSRYHMELHMVHENNEGKLAVVGITYKFGRPDPFLQKIIPHVMPIETTELGAEIDAGIINPRDIKIGSRKYYRYIGSLTVPPCSEGVIWTLVKKVRTVSREQVRILREAVHDGCEENARPVQPQDGRTVLLYTPTGTPGSR